jgi:hypothetical protein
MEERGLDDSVDLLTAIYIQQSRMYDVIVALLSETNPEMAARIVTAHAAGEILGPVPALKGADDDSNA